MNVYFLLFLPCFVSFFTFLAATYKPRHNVATVLLQALSLLYAVFFFIQVEFTMPMVDFHDFELIDSLMKILLLVIPGFAYLWMRETLGQKPIKHCLLMLFIVPVVLGVCNYVSFIMMGDKMALDVLSMILTHNEAFDYFGMGPWVSMYSICQIVFRILLYIAAIGLIVYSIFQLYRLSKAKYTVMPVRYQRMQVIGIITTAVMMFVRWTFSDAFWLAHIPYLCIWSVLDGFLLFTMFWGAHMNAIILEFPQQMREIRFMESKDYASLQSQFEHLMLVEERCYFPDITVRELIESLNTNRTYLQSMLLSCYNMDLHEWLLRHRVAKAQEVLLANPTMPLGKVADRCGMRNVGTLVMGFRLVTGRSPMDWIKLELEKSEEKKK